MKTIEKVIKLLETLDEVVEQSCFTIYDKFDSMGSSAYADAIRVLSKYDRLVIEKEIGDRVIAVRPKDW